MVAATVLCEDRTTDYFDYIYYKNAFISSSFSRAYCRCTCEMLRYYCDSRKGSRRQFLLMLSVSSSAKHFRAISERYADDEVPP